MDNGFYSIADSVSFSSITQENPVTSVRREFEAVLREAATARERLSCAQLMVHSGLQTNAEAQAEYESAKRLAYVTEERMKNAAGRIISFGLLTYDEVNRMSAPYGY
jgi:hypothetical protein